MPSPPSPGARRSGISRDGHAMDGQDSELRRTPLHDLHEALGGRMVPFAGWRMPVQYSSILDEARAVRSGAGLFDVSHMGRFQIRGPDAVVLLNRVLSPNIPNLRIRRARYGVICNQEGGIIDDAIVYRLGAERYLLVPNASNAETVADWIEQWRRESDRVEIEIATSRLAMIALQGPAAQLTLSGLTDHDLTSLRLFRVVEAEIAGAPSLIARTGYTGEDGFELMVPAGDAVRIWEALAEAGAVPCGLGARDVLRLEAGLPLHGNDIDAGTNPFEAGLDRFVDLEREEYVARDALLRIREEGPSRRLVGFYMVGRGIARQGYAIESDGLPIGRVTSGSFSPTLGRAIGMGYVQQDYSGPGTVLSIDIRGRPVEAEVTLLPFYAERQVPILAPIG